jgi:hypothetical protein
MQMCGLHSGPTHKWEDNIKVAGYSEHGNKMLVSMFHEGGHFLCIWKTDNFTKRILIHVVISKWVSQLILKWILDQQAVKVWTELSGLSCSLF